MYFIDEKAFSKQTWSIPQLIPRQAKQFCRDEHSDNMDISPSNAIMSFLPEVQLCMSSLPGGDFGVCSRCEIPKNTVIGPYKGRRVKLDEVKMRNDLNGAHLWEV